MTLLRACREESTKTGSPTAFQQETVQQPGRGNYSPRIISPISAQFREGGRALLSVWLLFTTIWLLCPRMQQGERMPWIEQ